ncbi:MAG: sugar phosphate isomerase/epimerase family protein [Planctomycetota bacterium]
MIKFCFCTIAFQNKKWGKDRQIEVPLLEILPMIADAGYDGVEIWGPHVMEMVPEQRETLARRLQDLDLDVAMISPYFNFTTSEETAAESVREGLEVLSVARRLNSRGIRCFTGKTASADATEEQWQRTARSVQQLADSTRPGRTIWAFETHSWNLMDTQESSLELMRRIDRSNVGLIFQPSTFGEQYMEALDNLAPHIRHVHATNKADGERSLLGEGDMDYEQIVAGLRRIGFDGYISVEWMGDDPAGTAAREAEYLRDLLGRE